MATQDCARVQAIPSCVRDDGKSVRITDKLVEANIGSSIHNRQWISEREKEKGNEHFKYVF